LGSHDLRRIGSEASPLSLDVQREGQPEEDRHSTLELVPPESLLGNSLILRIDTNPGLEAQPLPEISEDSPEEFDPRSPSHLKRLNSTARRLLSRKSSLGSTISRRSSSIRSSISSRTLSVRSRWSFRPGRDVEGDLEEGGIRAGAVEMDGGNDGEVFEMSGESNSSAGLSAQLGYTCTQESINGP
jgi:hypothetical protein